MVRVGFGAAWSSSEGAARHSSVTARVSTADGGGGLNLMAIPAAATLALWPDTVKPANKSKEKEECAQWTKIKNVGRPRRTQTIVQHYLQKTMLSPLSRNTSRIMCLFVIIPLSHGSANLSTNQRTACVARTCPNGGVQWDEYGLIRLTLGHAKFWQWKRHPCRTLANWTVRHPPIETRHELSLKNSRI